MKLDKYFMIMLCTVTTLHSFLSPSIAQEMGREELLEEMYLVVDYDEAGESESAMASFYSPGFSATVDNKDPQLSNGKVTPEYGGSSTQFYFSVDYSDSNEDVPATIGVYIDDAPSSVTLDSGSAYNGTYKSEAKTLSSGTHTYYFVATDGDGGSARLPASGSNSGPTVNDNPQLSNGVVSPSSGTSSTQFFYEVTYQDPNNDAPATIYVYINGTPSYMTLDSGLTYNGTYKSSIAQMLVPGTHSYYFTAEDGEGGSVRLPTSGSYSGPTVNDLPQLSNGMVDPDSGNSSTSFYYYVDYYDGEEDIPETSYVYVDNTAYEMDFYSGESPNGTYRYGPKLLETGNHSFYFSFTDKLSNTTRLPVAGSFSGPTINDPPQISGGRVNPDSGSGSTDFYYYVDYYDGEEDIPETSYVYIDDTAYEMDLYNGESYNGTYRYGPKLLKTGSHDFYFSFTDGYNEMVRIPPDGSYSGPEMVSGSIYVYDNLGGATIILNDTDSGHITPATLSSVDVGIHKVSLSKNDYVSLPAYATILVIQDQTVEVPFILMPCPAEITLEDETDHLHLLRHFRDSLLNKNAGGKEYIDLYYIHASEISLLILGNQDLRIRMGKLLHQFIPLLKFSMEEVSAVLPSELMGEIKVLIDDFEEKGSPFLKAALKRVRMDLQEGIPLKDLGFEVEEDSF